MKTALWRGARDGALGVGIGVWRWSLELALLLALASCGGGGDAAPTASPSEASAVIGPAGGTLDGPDGARVVIPAGALASDTTITIARRDTGAPTVMPEGSSAGATYEFTPHDIVFAQPATLRIPFVFNPQAATQDVLRAGPGQPWMPLGVAPAGGLAEWQSATFSWYTSWACSIPVPSPDPYPCSGLGAYRTSLVATPSSALVWQGLVMLPDYHLLTATAAATLQLTTTFSAPPDCGDFRVDFKRRRQGDASAVVLSSVTPTVTVDSDGRRHATAGLTVALDAADNGRTVLNAAGSCRRAYQSPSRANLAPEQQRLEAVSVFVIQTNIAQSPVAAPQVTQQPVSASVTAPASATFSAAASGSPAPTVQWQLSTDGGASWSDIAGATGPSHATGATTAADNGKQFRAVFSNSAGSAISAAAVLGVTAPPGGGSVPVGKLALGWQHSCAVTSDERLACWGYNSSGQIGQPNRQSAAYDAPVIVPLAGAVTAVGAGLSGTCAVHDGGTLSCWGSAGGGASTPRQVASTVTAVAFGYAHHCFIAEGWVSCLGSNEVGQLGQGNVDAGSATPLLVIGASASGPVVAIAAGAFHTCALSASGGVRCWGQINGELDGQGQRVVTPGPTPVAGLGAVSHIAAADEHTCAVAGGGTVWCWGRNQAGQLGQGTQADTFTASALQVPGLSSVNALAAGTRMSCAASGSGSVQCWGTGPMGRGSAVAATQTTPQPVPGLAGVQSVAIGTSTHACALVTGGGLKCWGSNSQYQLGTGDNIPRGAPTDVATALLFWQP